MLFPFLSIYSTKKLEDYFNVEDLTTHITEYLEKESPVYKMGDLTIRNETVGDTTTWYIDDISE